MKILIPLALTAFLVASIGWWNFSKTSDLDTTDDTTDANNEIQDEENGNDTTLNLSGEGLTKVPDSVFKKTTLTNLNLSNNQLSGSLPAEIRLLQNLKTLNLSDNQFTGVPAEIGQLKSLEVLDLSNNQLTGLPYELGNLSSLKQLNLSGNAYSEADLANIKKNLPATTVIIVD